MCQNVENPDKSPSKEPKISLRKDIYDSQNCDKINENEEALDLPLYSPEQDSSSPTKIVQTVPPSHEHLKVDLLEASSAVPGKLQIQLTLPSFSSVARLIISQLL